MAMSAVIFEGRITFATENASAIDTTFVAFDVTVTVLLAHKGVSVGDELALLAQVPREGRPLMCPQWDRGETFTGKYVVGATGSNADGHRGLSRWSSAFLGSDAAGAEYEAASRMARIAAGGGPELPSLTATLARQECGAPGTIRGSRFTPNSRVVLFYPGSLRGPEGTHPMVVVANDGRFEHKFALPVDYCPDNDGPSQAFPFSFVDAYPEPGPGGIGGPLLAMAPLLLSKGVAPGPPDAGNSSTLDAAGHDARMELASASAAAGVVAVAICLAAAWRRRRT